MGWSDYRDPAEQRAANEAAEHIAAQQAAEDARADTLATAVLTGLSMVADAIRAAAGLPETGTALADAATKAVDDGVAGVEFSRLFGISESNDPADDAEIDDLIDPAADCGMGSSPQTARGETEDN